MLEEEVRKVDLWTARYKLVEVAFPNLDAPAGPLDPCFDSARSEDLEAAAWYLI